MRLLHVALASHGLLAGILAAAPLTRSDVLNDIGKNHRDEEPS